MVQNAAKFQMAPGGGRLILPKVGRQIDENLRYYRPHLKRGLNDLYSDLI